jgi:hypothetical protein
MMYHRLCRQAASSLSTVFTPSRKRTKRASALTAVFLATLPCLAQDQPQPVQEPDPQPQTQAEIRPSTVTIPAGTSIALVLTHPIQSRYIHHGDDIYAQVNSPVNSDNEIVIPPGTFVQGKVDKLAQRNGRGEIHLQSMSITFPDGYVAPVSGPIVLESTDGYALKDPGRGRFMGMFALPAAGAGLGALIGHAAANTKPGMITSTLPPGCTGPPPGCLLSSVSVPAHPGMSIAMGAGIGAAVGMVSSFVFLASTHSFFLDVGSPVEMTLQQPVTLQRTEVAEAVRHAEEHPTSPQPIAQRRAIPRPTADADHGTCYTPGTPGTPDTVIPGMPGPDGVPGPPTVIPGLPATPGTPYPCP